MKSIIFSLLVLIGLFVQFGAKAQPQMPAPANLKLADLHWRDMCIYPDPVAKTYYMVGPGRRGVRCYISKDLLNWYGPQVIYDAPADVWGDIPIVSIWAPELHAYKGKYYLFLTFDTKNMFQEQWRGWYPRVTRGSQVLAGDSPTGPFKPFQSHSTTPVDMMTLDGTLWVEDGIPYMVFCHEWVQITNGAICYVKLKDDLSETDGEPVTLFHAGEAVWSKSGMPLGNNVTDGCYLYKGKTGKLYMLWTSGGKKEDGMTTGIAISESGKIAGPWVQQDEPLYKADGGHAMLFKSFDGKLMMVLHSPYNGDTRPHIFEMEDTGNTLHIVKEFKE
jgi:arabinan endo-1,5-alpha-L-arabinosidase